MDIADILDKQTMDAILADAKASGISAKDVNAVLGTLTDQTKAPTRSAASQGELISLLSDDKEAVASDISAATGVERSTTSTILMLAAPFLLKHLLGGSSSNSNTASFVNLLGALLGGQPQQPSPASTLAGLLGGQPQQPSQASMLGALLGGQHQQPSGYVNNSTASLLGSLLGGSAQQPTAGQNSGVGQLLNLMGNPVQQPQQPQQPSGQSGGILNALFNLLGDN